MCILWRTFPSWNITIVYPRRTFKKNYFYISPYQKCLNLFHLFIYDYKLERVWNNNIFGFEERGRGGVGTSPHLHSLRTVLIGIGLLHSKIWKIEAFLYDTNYEKCRCELMYIRIYNFEWGQIVKFKVKQLFDFLILVLAILSYGETL